LPAVFELQGTDKTLAILKPSHACWAFLQMKSADKDQNPIFWREVIRAYGFPIVMFALAIIPGLNFTYSGHGGFSWFIIPLCFPYVILRATVKIMKGSEDARRWYKRFYKITVPSYFALALLLSSAATASLKMTFGLDVSTWVFLGVMISPFPWFYFT
jgi:hypothetical protein